MFAVVVATLVPTAHPSGIFGIFTRNNEKITGWQRLNRVSPCIRPHQAGTMTTKLLSLGNRRVLRNSLFLETRQHIGSTARQSTGSFSMVAVMVRSTSGCLFF